MECQLQRFLEFHSIGIQLSQEDDASEFMQHYQDIYLFLERTEKAMQTYHGNQINQRPTPELQKK